MEETKYIGKEIPRVDGLEKATGKIKYMSDLEFPDMLYGKILRSPHPHARIVNIDASQALALPGVKAVVTGKDTLGIKQGIWRRYTKIRLWHWDVRYMIHHQVRTLKKNNAILFFVIKPRHLTFRHRIRAEHISQIEHLACTIQLFG